MHAHSVCLCAQAPNQTAFRILTMYSVCKLIAAYGWDWHTELSVKFTTVEKIVWRSAMCIMATPLHCDGDACDWGHKQSMNYYQTIANENHRFRSFFWDFFPLHVRKSLRNNLHINLDSFCSAKKKVICSSVRLRVREKVTSNKLDSVCFHQSECHQ